MGTAKRRVSSGPPLNGSTCRWAFRPTTIKVIRRGAGVPIVFLHAFPLNRRMWEAQEEQLSRNFQTLSLDFPGFGDTPAVSETHSMEFMASEVLEALSPLQLNQKCIFVGLSMGGYVLFQILRKNPEIVRAAVLISTKATPDSPTAREKRFQNIALVERDGTPALAERMLTALLGKSTLEQKPETVALVRGLMKDADQKGVCAALRGMAERPDSSPFLAAIDQPLLILAGEEDTVIPPAEMEGLSKGLKKSEFHVVPGAGHLLNLEQPQAFQDLFLHFLKRRVL